MITVALGVSSSSSKDPTEDLRDKGLDGEGEFGAVESLDWDACNDTEEL